MHAPAERSSEPRLSAGCAGQRKGDHECNATSSIFSHRARGSIRWVKSSVSMSFKRLLASMNKPSFDVCCDTSRALAKSAWSAIRSVRFGINHSELALVLVA